jgi:hypothetical protein
MDSVEPGLQDLGVRKLADCIPCKNDGKYPSNSIFNLSSKIGISFIMNQC